MAKEMSRRSFLKTGAAAALGLAVVPSTVLGKKFGYTAPSDKLNILGVGGGGRGAADLQAMESQNIIGLCDVDWKYADHVFKRYPAAKKYNDYRRMYDELLKEADAVMVATADHTHAIIAAEAMTEAIHQVLARSGVALDDVACIVPHQANERIIRYAAKKMDLPMERFQVIIDHVGNVSGASALIALNEALCEGKLQPGDIACMTAFGGGLTAGSCVIRI